MAKKLQFRRRGWYKHKRIGKGKRRMVGWKKPKGRDNKMRESRKGRPPLVSIGYKRSNEDRKRITVYNVRDLENAGKGSLVILGKVGRKNKTEIVKKAHSMGITFQNLNIKKFLKKINDKNRPGAADLENKNESK